MPVPVGPQPGEATKVSLYERWKKIYPLWVDGPFQTLRRMTLAVLLLIFFASPWLTWDGHPAVWFNLPERKFVMLWATFWPQEFILLAGLLIIAAFALFFFTVLAGRVWCGWACPQTVWTLCYVYIEHWIEGDRNQRLRLDRAPWTLRKLGKKVLKWSLWTILSGAISLTLVGYFTPIRELLPSIARMDLSSAEWFWLLLPAGMSYLLGGVLREQVCFHMCPYARFQSVMFDRDTLIISYDSSRGEPRGSRRRSADYIATDLGSCIDCRLCVNVCPTGIDIRDGLQYGCIGCAACVDVCNSVMRQMKYPEGLIRYSSENRDQGAERSSRRPRLLGYGAVLAIMLTTLVWSTTHRSLIDLDIIRDRNRLYRERWDGSVENVYTLRIMNREQRPRTYRIQVEGEVPFEYEGRGTVQVAASSQLSLPVRLLMPGDQRTSAPHTPVNFTVETIEEPFLSITEASRFLRPAEDTRDDG